MSQTLFKKKGTFWSVAMNNVYVGKNSAEIKGSFKVLFNNCCANIKMVKGFGKIKRDFTATDNHNIFNVVGFIADLLENVRSSFGRQI